MVGGTTHQPQQAPQLPPQSSSSSTAPATTHEEDELLKRNTDCVYFLASPLTCKKGSECEYRHSDIARVNPRDCWYWLNGNCLNPKCAFRHPPLDGLLGADGSTPTGPSVPAPHAAPYAAPKQGVACIFFQKGFCLKGHLCPFLHGPPFSVNNKAPQSGPANPVTEPPKTTYSGLEKPIQEKKFTQQVTVQKPAARIQAPVPVRNGGGGVDKKVPPPSSMGFEELPRYKPTRVGPVNETPSNKPSRGAYQAYHVSDNNRIVNGKDADEYSREPSPGFDVLVDNELGEPVYYHSKDEFGRPRDDYDVERDTYRERDYGHYNERDAWDDHRSSSVGSGHLERRLYPRNESPDRFEEPDLRHRISKQRRGSNDGLRSVVSREYEIPRRDSHNTIGSRLRGRITIPGRSISPTNENDSRTEREIDTGRKHQSRYSPPSFNQSRLRDRIMGNMFDNDTKFAGPKRLSELRNGRTGKGSEQQLNDSLVPGKRKYPDDLSFEGPKPLSEILKRKRGVETETQTKTNNQNENETVGAIKNTIDEPNSVSTIVELEKRTGSSNMEKLKPEDGKAYEVDEDALLDEELEAYDHRDGDYEYEQIDGEEDYNLEEGEYEEGEGEEVGYS